MFIDAVVYEEIIFERQFHFWRILFKNKYLYICHQHFATFEQVVVYVIMPFLVRTISQPSYFHVPPQHIKVFECPPDSEYHISTQISTLRAKGSFYEII